MGLQFSLPVFSLFFPTFSFWNEWGLSQPGHCAIRIRELGSNLVGTPRARGAQSPQQGRKPRRSVCPPRVRRQVHGCGVAWPGLGSLWELITGKTKTNNIPNNNNNIMSQ